jgi:hypothetical protein
MPAAEAEFVAGATGAAVAKAASPATITLEIESRIVHLQRPARWDCAARASAAQGKAWVSVQRLHISICELSRFAAFALV